MSDIANFKLKPPIFIGGEGRSGTRLLRSILGKNPSIYEIPRETYNFVESKKGNKHFAQLEKRQDWLGLTLALLLAFHYRKEVAIMKFTFLHGDYENLLERWQDLETDAKQNFDAEIIEYFELISHSQEFDQVRNRYHLFDLIASFLTKRFARKRWVEKTPANIFHVNNIFSKYSDAKFIMTIRDPRATVASWLKKDKKESLVSAIWSWNRASAQIISIQKQYSSDQLYLLRYEDLLQDPENQVKKLCDFLGEDFEDEMLDVEVSNVHDSSRGSLGFNQASLNKWQVELSKYEVSVIDFFTSKNRKEFGY